MKNKWTRVLAPPKSPNAMLTFDYVVIPHSFINLLGPLYSSFLFVLISFYEFQNVIKILDVLSDILVTSIQGVNGTAFILETENTVVKADQIDSASELSLLTSNLGSVAFPSSYSLPVTPASIKVMYTVIS